MEDIKFKLDSLRFRNASLCKPLKNKREVNESLIKEMEKNIENKNLTYCTLLTVYRIMATFSHIFTHVHSYTLFIFIMSDDLLMDLLMSIILIMLMGKKLNLIIYPQLFCSIYNVCTY